MSASTSAPNRSAPGTQPSRGAPPAAAAPEPSMDELLASIRRIIAEEDLSVVMPRHPDPAADLSRVWAGPDPVAPRVERHDAPPQRDPAAAAPAPSRPAPQNLQPQPARPAEGSAPGREAPRGGGSVPARSIVRPEPARDDPRRDDMRRTDPPRSAPPRPERSAPAQRPEEAGRPARIAGEPGNDPRRESVARWSEAVQEAAQADAAPVEPPHRDGRPADSDRVERLEGARPAPAAPRDLLGPDADAALSAAFAALGDLALPQQPRTVEDLVKEMLRPMLKAWLDRNLPAMVEDLVRAEIERVSARNRRG